MKDKPESGLVYSWLGTNNDLRLNGETCICYTTVCPRSLDPYMGNYINVEWENESSICSKCIYIKHEKY